MTCLQVGDAAPGFELPDHNGEMQELSKLLKEQRVLLVFNIGFA